MSVGLELKTARLAKKITLETISQKTKIPVKYLESLEQDQFDVFPSQVYAKSFIRAYAKVIGMDPSVMTRQFNAEVKPKEVRIEPVNAEAEMERGSPWSPIVALAPVSSRNETHDDPELERLQEEDAASFRREPSALRNRRVRTVRRNKWLRRLGTVMVFVFGLTLLAGVFYYTQKGVATIQWSQLMPKPAVEPAASGVMDLNVPDKYQHLVLKGLDKSWVQVVTDDGKSTFEDDMDEGEVKIYQAEKNFKIKIGNAGGIDIQYNGKALGVLGVTGQVVEIDLPVTDNTDDSADKS
jgi:transcriptional regulator with XRE-family HTH domain